VDWLNYHHLFYFWLTAREGGVTAAAKKLKLAQSTVSAQLQQLEGALGAPLFTRSGRALELTDEGRTALRYADEIFALGRQLSGELRGQVEGPAPRLVVGVVDALPKLIVYRLLSPALRGPDAPPLVCVEGSEELLLQRLAAHDLDLVLLDNPALAPPRVRLAHRLLGASRVSFFAGAALARTLRAGFPRSLDGAPFLLPAPRAALRRSLIQWFDARKISPRVAAEIDDSALLKAFASAGHGVIAAPFALAAELRRQYGVRLVGHAAGLQEHFYAVTAGRRAHPAVAAVFEAARELLT